VRAWNLQRWTSVQEPVFVGPAESAAFSPDRETIVLGGADGTIRMWDLGESRHALGRSVAELLRLAVRKISRGDCAPV
jgi:WD40 repeat protein